jgi:hypothetical protein
MRVLTIPIIVLGLFAPGSSDEPSEAAMRAAFATRLSEQVRSVLDFVEETGGRDAVDAVRMARTDEFDIRSLKKVDCTRSATGSGYVCEFAVRIGVVSGTLEHTLSGRFYVGPRGLIFAYEDSGSTGT